MTYYGDEAFPALSDEQRARLQACGSAQEAESGALLSGDERAAVEALIADAGFRPQYMGEGPDAHWAVDSLATLWFALAFGQHRGRRLAFRLLTNS